MPRCDMDRIGVLLKFLQRIRAVSVDAIPDPLLASTCSRGSADGGRMKCNRIRARSWKAILVLTPLWFLCGEAAAAVQLTFYVSPAGSDANPRTRVGPPPSRSTDRTEPASPAKGVGASPSGIRSFDLSKAPVGRYFAVFQSDNSHQSSLFMKRQGDLQ